MQTLIKTGIRRFSALLTLLVVSALWAPPVKAHGPQGHGGQSFTVFQAVQKGTQLFDKLLAKNKIDEAFETDLKGILISQRIRDGKTEFVVQFNRTKGEPASVYIFFDASGKYVGSNFSGE